MLCRENMTKNNQQVKNFHLLKKTLAQQWVEQEVAWQWNLGFSRKGQAFSLVIVMKVVQLIMQLLNLEITAIRKIKEVGFNNH